MPLITLDHLPWIIGVGASVGFVGCVTRTLLLLLTWRPWHKQPSSPLLGEEGPFDFILVGAGSGGAVLAARLVDRGFRVLLLEAGEKDSGPFFKVPIAALGYQATDHHWGYEAEEQEELTMQGAHWGGPSVQGCRGRPLILTRGRAVGGSSSINLCNYVRGHPSEFDAWADELGLEGWSSREMLADYHAAEGLGGAAPAEDRDRPTARRGAAPPAVLLERVRPTHALSTAFVTSCKRLLGGHAPSHALEPPAEGAALHWQSISGGVRCSNARLLHSRRAADAQAKGQLRVETGVRVLRVLLAPSAEPSEPNDAAGDAAAADTAAGGGGRARVRAVGVLAEHERHGTRVELRATREVVLCAGAINSPHLLLLSGIGPTKQLERHGIRTHVDLPGVGESLRDVGQVRVHARCTERLCALPVARSRARALCVAPCVAVCVHLLCGTPCVRLLFMRPAVHLACGASHVRA
jgi:choline dehydrogenase